MNLVLSPKALFRQNEDQVKAFKAISHNAHFLIALSSALAEFAQRSNPTMDQLIGARQFISVLLNIAEDESAPTRTPIKRLDHEALEKKV